MTSTTAARLPRDEFSPVRSERPADACPVWLPRPAAGFKPPARARRRSRPRLRLHADDLALLARVVGDAVALALEKAGLTDPTRGPVAERESERTAAPALLSPRQVGERIGRSPEWVREHRGEFVQVRFTEGERPRLLFTAASVDAWLEARAVKPALAVAELPAGTRRRRGSVARTATGVELLPIRHR
jgi:hypothetical protein